MKRFFALSVIFLLFSQNLLSQNKDLQSDRVLITIMPYSMIDYSPRFRFGVEYYSTEKFGYSLDFGFGNNKLGLQNGDWGENYTLLECRTELKYFFVLKEYIAFYAGPEFFLIQTQDFRHGGWYRKEYYPQGDDLNLVTSFDFATFNRQKYGAHLKVGLKLIAFKRVDFDFYAGIGAAFRTVEYSQVVNPIDQSYFMFFDGVQTVNTNEGESLLFHIALGGKIGIILWGK